MYDRSAWPSSPWGVGRHKKTKSACGTASPFDVENRKQAVRESFGHQFGHAVLEDRYAARVECLDPVDLDIGANHLVAEVGQARRGRQTDVTRTNDRHIVRNE